MTRSCLVVFPGLVALGVERRSLRVQGSNRLQEEESQTISSFFSQMESGSLLFVQLYVYTCVKQFSYVITMDECFQVSKNLGIVNMCTFSWTGYLQSFFQMQILVCQLLCYKVYCIFMSVVFVLLLGTADSHTHCSSISTVPSKYTYR